ncbi:MAG: sensor histidine kinase [Candidatus Thiodiazotropha sp.]
MSIRSLRFRLLSAATVFMLLALILAGFSLVKLFEHHLERRFDSELETYLNQLIGRLDIDRNGRIHVTGNLVDPRFEEPLSGLYWQVQDDARPTLLRSRSLWDNVIKLPQDQLQVGEVHHHRLPGPADQELMVQERQIILEPDTLARRLRVAVARDSSDLHVARHAFAADMLPYFVLLALFLTAASWVQVRMGLSPLELVRNGVLAIRGGRVQRLQDPYPDEVMPLVEEINELLEARDAMVERARAWTADLAHGLKTPLSALGADAQRLRNIGQPELANDLDELAQFMRRRVDRELIRARLRSADTAVTNQSDLVRAIRRVHKTLERTPQGEHLQWDLFLPEQINVCLRDDDLTELLGNLLDNASKWANSRVRVSIETTETIDILIEDDGPGVAETQLERLGERGIRLDQQTHGYGLGLAIVRDIVEAYHGVIDFSRSPLGGLAVRVRLSGQESSESI